MLTGNPAGIPAGEACAFQLPPDPSAASHARSLTAATMRQLGYATDPIEDAKLAVSELATNALTHASSTAARPELWIWARTHPTPQLVVSVFDAHRDSWPVLRVADPSTSAARACPSSWPSPLTPAAISLGLG
ncbi:hypothetical protein LUW74_32795 [Actinomadura madurae]|uniref:ATP-binding protein n=1 Tax=Actinomadura madurae TaxID=1993 RepID=UPI00202755CF|nr:ATP-binding protein [Actinomadura madurae]URN07665.1 hypothetical protein LUW74_32795 [Actinomadura madurae]